MLKLGDDQLICIWLSKCDLLIFPIEAGKVYFTFYRTEYIYANTCVFKNNGCRICSKVLLYFVIKLEKAIWNLAHLALETH